MGGHCHFSLPVAAENGLRRHNPIGQKLEVVLLQELSEQYSLRGNFDTGKYSRVVRSHTQVARDVRTYTNTAATNEDGARKRSSKKGARKPSAKEGYVGEEKEQKGLQEGKKKVVRCLASRST